MKKKFSLVKYVLIPMLMIVCGISSSQLSAMADSRYKVINDLYPGFLDNLCEDNGKLYISINENLYFDYDGGFDNASYRLEISDKSVVEPISDNDFRGKKIGLKGKKKGTAVLTVRKYQNGKYTVLYETQVVVGQPRFYKREVNIGMGDGLPELKDPNVLLGCQYLDDKYSYTYRIHDTSIIKKKKTVKEGKVKYDIYEALKFGSTKVDIIETYKGKETVVDTITVNVRRPVLRAGDGAEIIHSMANADKFYLSVLRNYESDYEVFYESDDPSIIYKKKGEKFQLVNCGTTNLHVYCMIDGEKYHIGTVKVTIVP